MPFTASLSLSAFSVPLVRSTCPSELSVPSKSATPAIPVDGSTNPEAVRSRPLTLIFASIGLAETSLELMGPALPSSFAVPPAGRFAVMVKGNCEVGEKSRTLMSTLSYT